MEILEALAHKDNAKLKKRVVELEATLNPRPLFA
jgi:hypothetical protein